MEQCLYRTPSGSRIGAGLTRRGFLGRCGGSLALAACAGRGSETFRLGHFPNITHAAAIIGVENGGFAQAVAPRPLEVLTFNAGPAAIEALLSGGLDATFIGPNPTINGFVKSKGEALRVIAGATSGGAALIVRPGIASPADLEGKAVASPQLGGTQDVALRKWLADQGLPADKYGGGEVSVMPQENAQTLEAFREGKIAGAWVPEPWATRLILEGGGHVLVDERSLWPGGRFVTTHLVARTELLTTRADELRALLRTHVQTTTWARSNPEEAQALVGQGIARVTGKAIPPEVTAAAWQNLELTTDPLPDTLRASAAAAEAVGLLDTEGISFDTLWALDLLQAVEAEGAT